MIYNIINKKDVSLEKKDILKLKFQRRPPRFESPASRNSKTASIKSRQSRTSEIRETRESRLPSAPSNRSFMKPPLLPKRPGSVI